MDIETLNKDKKFLSIVVLALLLLGGMVAYPVYTGFLLILSLLIFGTLSSIWKEKHLRLSSLAALVLLAIANIALYGIKFGIDFMGGTRIPVVLEKPVDDLTMREMINTIKKRASVLGLTEIKVKAVGNTQIYVELPSSNPEIVESVENILQKQGVYLGIVDGKIAISGKDIIPATIYRLPPQVLGNADWGVGFSVTEEGAKRFAEVVKGKANYPLYMFLDRPEKAIIVINKRKLEESLPGISLEDAKKAMEDALRLEGDNTIVVFEEDVKPGFDIGNHTTVILSKNTPPEVKKIFSSYKNITIREVDDSELIPQFSSSHFGKPIVTRWEAVGLLSAPFLSPQITQGIPSYSYSITGPAEGTTQREKLLNAEKRVKEIESILKGGALPVKITLGSKTTIPAPLGKEFLKLSLIGLGIALVVVSLFVSLIYRKIKIVIPIILITIAEILILVSITGSFTIDLATMAGIIAAAGVSVDAQIVITDELLKKEGTKEEKLQKAFQIINTNVTVAILAMIPLLFSGLVEIIGFAVSTILGALLGVLLSRPAYAAIVEELI